MGRRYNSKHPPILPVEKDLIQKFIKLPKGEKRLQDLLDKLNEDRAKQFLPLLTIAGLKSFILLLKYRIKLTSSEKKKKPLVLPKIDLPQEVLDTNFFKAILSDDDYI